MPRFSERSKERLQGCHYDIIRLFTSVVEQFDCAIICGHRTEEEQKRAYNLGRSKLKFPDSKHNKLPSLACDAVAWPIQWENTSLNYTFGGYVMGVAAAMDIKIRWGGDWDGDWDVDDQTFNDLVHFEILET